jgi:hypothetical protein
VGYEGREQSLHAVARQMPWQAKKPVRVGNRRDWDFSKQMRNPDVKYKVLIVLFWKECDDAEASKVLVSNRLGWEVRRLVLVYRRGLTGLWTSLPMTMGRFPSSKLSSPTPNIAKFGQGYAGDMRPLRVHVPACPDSYLPGVYSITESRTVYL